MLPRRHVARLLRIALVALPLMPASLLAQSPGAEGLAPLATRVQLDSLASAIDAATRALPGGSARRMQLAAEAARIRERLRDGDFRVGDVVIVELSGATSSRDTLAVRSGLTIAIPNVPPISLAGVLRAEVEAHARREVSRYLRDPQLRATPLTRMAIAGEVSRPGFYSIASDLPLSEVIMRAGGPSSAADLHKLSVRRGAEELLDAPETQEAIRRGSTLDQLDLRPGDELIVGARRQGIMQHLVPIVSLAAGLSSLLLVLR